MRTMHAGKITKGVIDADRIIQQAFERARSMQEDAKKLGLTGFSDNLGGLAALLTSGREKLFIALPPAEKAHSAS